MPTYPTYKFTDIASLIRGVSYDKSVVSTSEREGYIPILRANNIQKDLVLNDLVYVPSDFVKEEQMIRKGDIVLAMSSGSKDLVGTSAQADKDINAAFGTFCGLIRAKENIDSKFLGLYFQTQEYRNFVSYQSKGVNICNLKKKDIESLQIPLPPLPTQRAIVSRIESLFAELDKAVQHLRTAQQQLKTYRQAVLNHWLNNDDGKWGKKTAEECVVNENYSLAIGPFGSDLKVEDYTESGVKLVFVRDITSNFEDKKNKFVSEYKADQLKAHNVFKGDLLITKMGDPPGQTGIFPYDRGVITSDVLRMKTNDKILNKYYAMYYILSSEGGKQIKEMTQGVAQKKISLGRFKKFLFPIPSIPEQQRIVNEIESRLSQATATETCIENAMQQAEALRQSILKKAFNGELI